MDDQKDLWRREVTAFVQGSPGAFAASGKAAPELLLFQLEGVQEFVTQARTANDLWSASCLVSSLMACALRAVTDEVSAEAVLYPSLSGDALDAPRQGLSALPDRFLAVVPSGRGQPLAEKAQAALRAELARIGDTVFQEAWDRALWDAQLQRFPRVVWAVEAWRKEKDWTAHCADLGGKLAARRNTYDFDAWPAKGGEWKDSLSGVEEALAQEDGKPYGALNLIRRNWRKNGPGERSFRRVSAYFAVLAVAADGLPKRDASQAFTPALHLSQSAALAKFAAVQARQIAERLGGEFLYARGGDVLVLVPAGKAIPCAQQLRAAFRDGVGGELTCGIAIGYRTASFQMLLREAYRMRAATKSGGANAAISLVIYKRASEIIEWGCAWRSKALELMETVSQLNKAKRISNRFPYVLAELLQPYGLGSPIFSAPVILAEFAHVASRQGRDQGDALFGMATQYLCEIPQGKVQDFLNLFRVGNFFDRISGGYSA